MPPHGGGMVGSAHSHDPEFPDDTWNLYAMLDKDLTTALNVTNPAQAVGIFKPFALRLTEQPEIISESDPEILVIANFTSPVHIRKIMVIGGGRAAMHPSRLRCYVNRENVDFTNVEDTRADQEFTLPVNEQGTVELITAPVHRFSNVSSIAFYFPANHDDATTVIKYIGLQGEHTHYRREAVDAVYEVLCNGQDIAAPTDEQGALQEGKAGHGHLH
jgi:hypothetical protein